MIKDSGKREEFKSGAVRDSQEGRGRCDLLPLDCLVGEYGEDPVLLSIYQFQRDNALESIENAIKFFEADAFENEETAILELSIHYQDGAAKYGDNNWQKGLPVSRYLSSAIRHYLKFRRGDQDEPHDRAVLWNLTAVIWTCLHKPELNDYATKVSDNNRINTTPDGPARGGNAEKYGHMMTSFPPQQYCNDPRGPWQQAWSSTEVKPGQDSHSLDAARYGHIFSEQPRQCGKTLLQDVIAEAKPEYETIIINASVPISSDERFKKQFLANAIAKALGIKTSDIKGGSK